MKLCEHCGQVDNEKDCHALKYGKFISYLVSASYNGNFDEEKEKLSERFRWAYHAIHQWDKCTHLLDGQPAPIKAKEVKKDLPYCIGRYGELCLEIIQKRSANTNNNK